MELTDDQIKLYRQKIAKANPVKVDHSLHITEYVYEIDGVIIEVLTAAGLEDGNIKAFTKEEYAEYSKPLEQQFAEMRSRAESRKAPRILTGVDLIKQERERHFELGYDASHDAHEVNGELAVAAGLYALDSTYANDIFHEAIATGPRTEDTLALWPWEDMPDKRGNIDRIRELTIAGALIAAEIDRLQNEGTTNNTTGS